MRPRAQETQVTRDPRGHLLTNAGVWSADGEWIVYDTRSDPAGSQFDGSTIESVRVGTGEIRVLYESRNGAHCGVPTFHPRDPRVAFILGPEHPTPDWSYGPYHRQGIIVDLDRQTPAVAMDARDVTPPFTPGALRGGSHVHVWHPAGDWISFTYEDHVLAQFTQPGSNHDVNQRNIGVSVPGHSVRVKPDHPRNHDSAYFSVLVTQTTARPNPGSDQISRACEEGWIGTNGYVRTDGTRQKRALAFQGLVTTAGGQAISEVFVADLPEDLTEPGETGPLEGTERRLPAPPRGVVQRRITRTDQLKHPGIQGPRHWLRSSPDGSQIAFLAKDPGGIVQLWTVSPNGGPPRQISRNPWPVESAFSWNTDGQRIAHVMDGSVCVTEAQTGQTTRLTSRGDPEQAPRPEACVFSPDGRKIAYVRRVPSPVNMHNQIFVTALP